MSAKLVEQEIKRFLADPTAEVLCIMGQWGVGKTFAWNQYLKTAIASKNVALKHYSYVSLFGQNSLEGLKYSIFENTLPLEKVGEGITFETLMGGLGSLKQQWRKGFGLIGLLPQAESYLPIAARGLFLSVKNQIVCIDDLERASDRLPIKDVMGLVSFLKEQRKCKIILLLNDEELKPDDVRDFDKQLEKVSDVEMRFEPTPQEAAQIGIDKSTTFHELFAKATQALGIVNIRVIRKTQRLILRLEALLKKHDRRLLEVAIPSMTLFGWAAYQPQFAPTLDFIKKFNPYGHLFNDKNEESDEEKKWRLTISATGFTHFDEFDQALLSSIEAGYFDEAVIEQAAINATKKLSAQDQDNSFSAAWSKYHGSFNCNHDEVLDDMYRAIMSGAKAISPANLDSSLGFFRKFDRNKEADELITHYMKERGDESREFFDPDRSLFLEIKDPSLKTAFETKLASFKHDLAPEDILFNIAKNSGWNPEDLQPLAELSAEEFYRMFKKLDGDKLRVVVSQALKFGRYTDKDSQMITIATKAEEALRKIAEECEINKMRVSSYGIGID